MAKHPIQVAWEAAAGPDIADAEEQYFALVAFATTDITTRDLERTKSVLLILGATIKFYRYDPSSVAAEDGDNVILDSEDRPFVKIATEEQSGAIALQPVTAAGTLAATATVRGYLIKRTAPETAAITFPAAADRAGVPITIADGDGSFEAHPQTITFDSGETARGAGTFVLDSNWQVATFYPQDDGTWIVG